MAEFFFSIAILQAPEIPEKEEAGFYVSKQQHHLCLMSHCGLILSGLCLCESISIKNQKAQAGIDLLTISP